MADSTSDLANMRAAWRAAHLVPLWESPTAHKPPTPPAAPFLWSWATVRPLLAQAMNITSPSVVERRVLQLVNPLSQSPEDEKTVRNLSGAIQMLLPGETARPHRHSMNALRFVLEGKGAETIVNGKVCPMEVGDLILTPAWCWHEHRHPGDGPMIWLDALDVPLHLSLGTAEFEPGPVKAVPATVPDAAFAVANLLPEGADSGAEHSPVFRYPYADAAAAVAAAPRGRDGARRVRYVNPLTGGAAMALMDCHLIQLEPGEPTLPFRANSNAICAVVEGDGTSTIGDTALSWRRHDIFTLPQGNWITHRGNGGARLFVTSDREILARLGLLREEYGNNAA
ncbi:MAG TPA: cupin domain-containing protein [Stellaceae bacterium]|nr:cupin domain-containing protein [Stellaceae bacterium]